ncbi:recombinase RecT [Capnocytophaga canimorsus]|uniref:recombinase RecT n=1 Tax=Capnocytophaga canimorsus TaxID=28188 RepID=UPI0037D626BC
MSTQVIKQQTIANFLNKSDEYLAKTLGKKKSEFVSNLIALSEADKSLQKCNPADLMKCAMNATALNLPLNKNLGYAYVIAYNQRDKETGVTEMKPQFQMGYKGFIQLAIRSGQYKTINTCEVREGEIRRNKFTGHTEFLGENPYGEIIGYLAYIELNNGFQQSLYMSVEQVQAHAKKYSQNYAKWNNGLWKDEFDLMAKKTVLKLLLNRFGVLSVEMQNAILTDQADSNGQYIDNPQGRYVVDADVIEQNDPSETEQPTQVAPQQQKQINFEDL